MKSGVKNILNERKTPLYKIIMEHLKSKIYDKELLPGQQLPTELELAKEFNVSRITSKKALEELEKEGLIYRKRGHGSFVSNTRYGMSNGSMKKVISMLMPSENTESWVTPYIRGAMDALNSKRYFLSIHCSGWDSNRERHIVKELVNEGIGGIIYYLPWSYRNIDIYYKMYIDKYPIVAIDKAFEIIPLSSVVSDNFNGGYKAAIHLLELGHRRIAYVSPDNVANVPSVRERFFGYCSALNDYAIDIDDEIVIIGHEGLTAGVAFKKQERELCRKIMSNVIKKGVTAVLFENDIIANKFIKVFHDLGVKIPEDISVVGFDDIDILDIADLKLTTVKQDFYRIGRRAAEIIMEGIETQKWEYIKEVIPVELVVRETTKQLK